MIIFKYAVKRGMEREKCMLSVILLTGDRNVRNAYRYVMSLQRRHVTFLSDNAEDATYIYVISVLTGMNTKGATNATVSVTLFGDQRESVKHVLEDDNVHLFKTGAEDWFVLAETSSLGGLTSIVLSVDFSNTRHYWYVS